MLSIYSQIVHTTLEPNPPAPTRKPVAQVPFYTPFRQTRHSSQHIFQPRIDVVIRSRVAHVQGIRDKSVFSRQPPKIHPDILQRNISYLASL